MYKNKKTLYFFLLPAFFFMVMFLYYPFFVNIYNSFFDMSGLVGERRFIGLENYITLLYDAKLHTAVINSFKMMAVTIVVQVGFAFVLALMVDSIKIGNQFFRTTFFFPIVISATAIGLLFNLMYNYYGGAFNQILARFGLDPVMWLSEKNAFLMISIPVAWQYVGFYFVIFLTGLGNISEDIYEAAVVDGATGLQKIFKITIPLMRNVIVVCLILGITGALKVFDLPWVIAPHGAPSGATFLGGTYMYETTFALSNVDYGSTLAFFIVILGVVVSQITNLIFKKADY
ncbi:sugar ABC transporter permease [Oscillospiraceae bacterium PP1C4]